MKEEYLAKFMEKVKLYGINISEVDRTYNLHYAMFKDNKDLVDPEYSAYLRTMVWVESKNPADKKSDSNRASAEKIEGFLIGPGEFRNKKKEMKDFITKYIKNSGRAQAQKMGYIDANGVYLDYRDKVFGKENTKRGEPLEQAKVNTEMSMYGFFRREGDAAFAFSKLSTANGDIAESWYKSIEFPKHAFTPVKTWGLIKEAETPNGMGMFNITGSVAEETKSVFKVDPNPTYSVDDVFLNQMDTGWGMNIYDVPEHATTYQKDYNRFIFVKGIIGNIRPEWATEWKGTPGQLSDENDFGSGMIKVWLPNGYEKLFGDGSIVYAFGKDYEIMHKNDATDKWDVPTGKIELRSCGAYAVKGYTIKPIEKQTKVSLFNAWSG